MAICKACLWARIVALVSESVWHMGLIPVRTKPKWVPYISSVSIAITPRVLLSSGRTTLQQQAEALTQPAKLMERILLQLKPYKRFDPWQDRISLPQKKEPQRNKSERSHGTPLFAHFFVCLPYKPCVLRITNGSALFGTKRERTSNTLWSARINRNTLEGRSTNKFSGNGDSKQPYISWGWMQSWSYGPCVVEP